MNRPATDALAGLGGVLDEPLILAHSSSERGEILLRRRAVDGGQVDELIVNGAFAMDSAETSSERRLARLAVPPEAAGGRMLLGGLGLGYTAVAALDLPLNSIEVVEVEPALVVWAQQGVTPNLHRLAREPRITLTVGDVAEVLLRSAPGWWDAVALDVDNGPDFLIHADNASLYTPEFLRLAFTRLAPGGRLAIWCQGAAPALMHTLLSIAPTAREHWFAVTRGERKLAYVICTLDRPLSGTGPGTTPHPGSTPCPGTTPPPGSTPRRTADGGGRE
jgi:spermidine synthase